MNNFKFAQKCRFLKVQLKPLEWDPFRHWLAVTSILLIAGAAGVAVPLALRVAAGIFRQHLNCYYCVHEWNNCRCST